MNFEKTVLLTINQRGEQQTSRVKNSPLDYCCIYCCPVQKRRLHLHLVNYFANHYLGLTLGRKCQGTSILWWDFSCNTVPPSYFAFRWLLFLLLESQPCRWVYVCARLAHRGQLTVVQLVVRYQCQGCGICSSVSGSSDGMVVNGLFLSCRFMKGLQI